MDRVCKFSSFLSVVFFVSIRLLATLFFGGVVTTLFETKTAYAAPFTCSPNVYLSQGPNSGQDLYDLTFPSGITNLGSPIRPSGVTGSQGTFNAIGFREADGFIYGLDRDENLIRIESDGQHISLNVPTGLPLLPNGGNGSNYVAGTVGPDGLYYVLSQTGQDVVHVIDVELGEVIANLPRPRTFNGADFVIDAQGHFAYLYSTQGEETRRLSLTNASGVAQGTVQSFGISTGETGTYGAAYLDANNRFFISNNTSNNVYEIDLAIDPSTGLPSGTPVLVATGSFGVDRNDGAFCPGAEFPVGAPPTNVTITAFIDVNGNDVHDNTEPLYQGGDAELEAGGVVVSTATTDTAGRGRLNNLSGGSNRRVRLRRNGRLVAEKSNITVTSGATTEVLIPIDPSGKIYDAATRDLIAGATVTMTDASGAALPAVCFSPASQQNQVTAADGFYRFDIVPGADALCPAVETEYRIEVSATGFDAPPSSAIAPQVGPYNPTGTTTNEIVPNTDRPVGGEPTTYYTSFLLGPGDPDVVNNHIALDATSSDPLASLTAFTCTGDFYQIHASPSAVSQVDLINGNFSTLGSTGQELRATGLDPSTGIAYAIGRDTNILFAIGNDGTVVDLGAVTGLPARNYATGDFGPNGYFYIRSNGNNRPLVAIDVNAVAVVEEYNQAAGSINPNTADIAFNPADGSFYTVESSQNDADLLRITINDSPTNPTFSVVELGRTGISTRGNNGNNVFGAMYADNQGSVFGIRNSTGLMYQFDISSGAPLIVGRAASTTQNDGFFCSDAVNIIPSDFGDAQTDGTVVDGITTNYGEASQARASDGLFIGTQAPTPEDSNVNASDNADGDANEEAVLVDAVRSETDYTASVSALNNTGSGAFLCGFIDAGATGGFNGAFDAASERVCVAVPTGAAAQNIDLNFTGLDFTAAPGSSTFLRLRLSSVQSEAEAPSGTGSAIGEVEDYAVTIVRRIDALDDDFTSAPVTAGTTTEDTVLMNDTLGGVQVTGADVDIQLTDLGGATGVTINQNGMLNIPTSLTAGQYTLTYQICEAGGVTVCDTATVQIEVVADPGTAGGILSCSITTDVEFTLRPNSAPVRSTGPNTWLYRNVANVEGVDYDLRVQEVGSRSRNGFSLNNRSDINLQNWNPRQGPYVILEYTLLFSSTGQPATVDRFRFRQGDIDGQNFNNSRVDDNMLEIIGFETAEVTSINFGGGLGFRGFLNGRSNPAGYRLIRQGSPSNVTNNSHDVSVEYTDKSSFRVLYGMTARSNWNNNTTRNFFFRSFEGVFVAGSTRACPVDYTDAPASYGETGHRFAGGLQLGDLITTESTPLSGADADADGGDDGITLPTLTQGQIATISAEVTGAGGFLQGWIDFNGNGTFEVGEQVASNLQDDGTGADATAADGIITFNVTVPFNAVTTQTFARFRWSTTAGLDEVTAAQDGEVEDYAVTIDARGLTALPPVPNATCTINWHRWRTARQNGRRAAGAVNPLTHGFGRIGTALGPNTWYEPTLTFNPGIDSFDNIANDNYGRSVFDETVENPTTLRATRTGEGFYGIARFELEPNVTATIPLNDPAFVDGHAFMAFDSSGTALARFPSVDSITNDGKFYIAANSQAAAGFVDADGIDFESSWTDNSLEVDVPADGLVFVHYVLADEGAAHRHALRYCPEDVGDAPSSYGAVAHVYDLDLRLGSSKDVDINLSGDNTAAVDDVDGDGDNDEDGITIPTLTQGQTATITAEVTGARGFLQGWIDFDGNGTFETSEQVATNLQDDDVDGEISVSVNVPADAVTTQTFARFRWSTANGLDVTTAAPDGEVEDYAVTVQANFAAPANLPIGTCLGWNGATGAFPNGNSVTLTAGTYFNSDLLSAAAGGQFSDYTPLMPAGRLVVNQPQRRFTLAQPVTEIYMGLLNVDFYSQTYTDQDGNPINVSIVDDNGNAVVAGNILQDNDPNTFSNGNSVDGVFLLSSPTPFSEINVEYTFLPNTSGTTDGHVFSFMLPSECDTSDAPATFAEASHAIVSGIQLGATINADTESMASPAADGDADDGITIPTLTQGQTATIAAEVNGAGGFLQGWMDFDGSGTFEDSEQIAIDLQDDGAGGDATANDGAITFDVAVPVSAVTTQTFARFRWSTTSGLDAATTAPNGEVEDYAVTIAEMPRVFSCSADVDIWYANDESGSVDASEFLDALDFVYQVTDEFRHSATDGAQSGIIGWGSDASPTDIIVPISETLLDLDDSGLMSDPGGPIVDGDGLGIREAYSVRVSTNTGTILARATNRLANLINGSNGRRTGIPQVAVILTDAPASQINDEGFNEGGVLWRAASDNLRAAGPDGTRVVVVLLAEAADAYNNDATARSHIDYVVGSDGVVVTTSNYAAAADPVNGFISQTVNAICSAADFPQRNDYSDAPVSYGDAKHSVTAGIQLGAAIDSDVASIASPDASGDGADDDGLTIPAITQGQTIPVSVNVTGDGGYLQAWVDWNGDGTFSGAGEQIITDLQDDVSGIDSVTQDSDTSTGTIRFNLTAPDNAFVGQTFARFRWSTTAALDSVTAASDGEVEDYALVVSARPNQPAPNPIVATYCAAPENWRDLPYSPSGLASIDGLTANVSVSGGPGIGDSFFFPRLGVFDGPEFAKVNSGVLGGPIFYNTFQAVDLNQTMTQTFVGRAVYDVRLHFGSLDQVQLIFESASNPNIGWELLSRSDDTGNLAGGDGFAFADIIEGDRDRSGADEELDGDTGFSADGTVRFYSTDGNPITSLVWRMVADPVDHDADDNLYIGTEVCIPLDRSDAPTSYGLPDHSVVSGVQLGSSNDADISILAGPNAVGDGAEDDGVAEPVSFNPGTVVIVPVNVTGSGFLNAWVDWNNNQVFDAIEQIAVDVQDLDGTGVINLPVTVPAGAVAGQTFARFRWSTNFAIGSNGPAPDGEVEDYQVTIGSGGTTLSGRIFIDNGEGGAFAHDGLIGGSETGGAFGAIALFDGVGNLIANATVNPDGTWSSTLPLGYSGDVQLVTTAAPGYRTISEDRSTLSGVVNANDNDGSYTFNVAAGTSHAGLNIGVIANPTLTQNQTTSVTPGQTVDLAHVYTATTSGAVSFALVDQLANPAGAFASTVFADLNCDGTPDQALLGPVGASAGQQICLVVSTQASAGVGPTASYSYGITASTAFANTPVVHQARNDDAIGAGTDQELVLRKLVSNLTKASGEGTSNTGDIGDVLRYRIVMSNPSGNAAADVVVYDETPAFTALNGPVPSPITLANGVTCALSVPTLNVAGYSGPLQWNCPGSFPPGGEGSLTFDVQISP